MHPEIVRTVLHQWAQIDETRKNKLMSRFLEENGESHSQRDWLLYLAAAFNIDEQQFFPPTPGFFEH